MTTAFVRAHQETRGAGALIEDFVEGPEFSVEAITQHGTTKVVAVTDKLTRGTPHFVELRHSQPTEVEPWSRVARCAVAMPAVAALGLEDCASHTELRLGRTGPVVMETGAASEAVVSIRTSCRSRAAWSCWVQ